uniref:Uncharacterized protein n=1 Tax=Anguilla anguilla TaxID=7936 RepID=A0A0E9SQL0_ANGAN
MQIMSYFAVSSVFLCRIFLFHICLLKQWVNLRTEDTKFPTQVRGALGMNIISTITRLALQ